jgi:hypothetical protein
LHAIWARWTGWTGSAHFIVGDKTVFILVGPIKHGGTRRAHFVHGNGTIFIQVRALKKARTFPWRGRWALLGQNGGCQQHQASGGKNYL